MMMTDDFSCHELDTSSLCCFIRIFILWMDFSMCSKVTIRLKSIANLNLKLMDPSSCL